MICFAYLGFLSHAPIISSTTWMTYLHLFSLEEFEYNSISCLLCSSIFFFPRKTLWKTLQVLPHDPWLAEEVNRWSWLWSLTLRGWLELNSWPPQHWGRYLMCGSWLLELTLGASMFSNILHGSNVGSPLLFIIKERFSW